MGGKGALLITGGSGFVAGWCVVRALQAGWTVRATLRDPRYERRVRDWVSGEIGANPDLRERLHFFNADLVSDTGWAKAAEGCAGALHIASPFPVRAPRNDQDLLVPAREGAVRVLKAAKAAGVKRVVLTSSAVAASFPEPPETPIWRTWLERRLRPWARYAPPPPAANDEPQRLYTEVDWSDPANPALSAHGRAKVLAERAAWDWVGKFGAGLEMTTILPGAVLGPVQGADFSASINLVKMLMEGALPGCPRLNFPIVDVRDLADLHLMALEAPKAAGERFVAASGPSLWVDDVASVLKAHLGDAGRHIATKEMPDWMSRSAALVTPALQNFVGALGKERQLASEKARVLLGWTPRPAAEAIAACAESLIDYGVVPLRARAA